jgi:Protein of unknown function (DUF1822)
LSPSTRSPTSYAAMTTTLLQATFSLPDREATWGKTQAFQNPIDRWTAYLNQLAVSVVVPLLAEEFASDRIRLRLGRQAQASQWSCVTGTMIQVGDATWLVLPTEQIDEESVSVPQEWLEIPDWAVQQVVAVEVNPDDGTARIMGYASAAMIKNQGLYQSSDRTYLVDRSGWIEDLATLKMIQSLHPNHDCVIANLPTLSIEQAHNLINRLGNVTQPRLEIPFQTWAALIQHGGWRQQFHQLRQTGTQPRSVLQWLRSGLQLSVDAFALDLGWQSIALQSVGARDIQTASSQTASSQTALVRPVTIDQQSYELRVKPIGDLEAEDLTWRFELQSAEIGGFIPAGVTLRLLTEDLQPFDSNEAVSTSPIDLLFLEVALEPGEGLVWEIEGIGDVSDREILWF